MADGGKAGGLVGKLGGGGQADRNQSIGWSQRWKDLGAFPQLGSLSP